MAQPGELTPSFALHVVILVLNTTTTNNNNSHDTVLSS